MYFKCSIFFYFSYFKKMDKGAINRDRKASKEWMKQMEKYSQKMKKISPFAIPQMEQAMLMSASMSTPMSAPMQDPEIEMRGGKVNSNLNAFHHRFSPLLEKKKNQKVSQKNTSVGILPRLQETKALNPMDYNPYIHFSGPFQEPIAKYHDYVKRSMIDGMKKQEVMNRIMEKAYGGEEKKGKGWNPALSSMDPQMEKDQDQVQDQDQDQDQDQVRDQDRDQDPILNQRVINGEGTFIHSRQILPIIRNRGGILCSSDHACTQPHRWSGVGLNYHLNKENPASVQNWILHAPSMENVKDAMINNGTMEIQGSGTVNGSVFPVGSMGPTNSKGSIEPNSSNGGKAPKMKLGAEYLSLPEGTWMPFKALQKIPRSSRAIYKDIPRVQKDIRGNPRFVKQENNWEGVLRYYRMIPQKPVKYGRVKLIGGLLRETAPIFPGE